MLRLRKFHLDLWIYFNTFYVNTAPSKGLNGCFTKNKWEFIATNIKLNISKTLKKTNEQQMFSLTSFSELSTN